MKSFKFYLLVFVCFLFGAFLGFSFWLSDKYVVPIVMYHHVDIKEHKDLNTVSPASFEHQMDFIKKNGYHVISLDALVEAIKENKPMPHKSVVITFDDGYDDNYSYAYPILKQRQFPATIFLISDFIGKEGYLDWSQIKEMLKNGVSFGSHTRHHAYLPGVKNIGMLMDEIEQSKNIIERNLGQKVNYFCYPFGGFNPVVKEIVKQSGYKAAVTTNRGFERYNKDLYEIKRVRFKDKDSDLVMRFKLSGFYNLFRGIKPPSENTRKTPAEDKY